MTLCFECYVKTLICVMDAVAAVPGSLSSGSRERTVFNCSLPASVCQSWWEPTSGKVDHCVLFSQHVISINMLQVAAIRKGLESDLVMGVVTRVYFESECLTLFDLLCFNYLYLCFITSSGHKPQTTCPHPAMFCAAASTFLELYTKPTVHIFSPDLFSTCFLWRCAVLHLQWSIVYFCCCS